MATPGLDAIIAMLAKLGFTNWLNSTPTASSIPYLNSSKELALGGAVTASKPMYIDSSSVPQAGNIPFATTMAGVVVSGMVSTTVSAFNITGRSNPGSDDTLMQGQLVAGARVTTFTKTGFIQVNITDSAGNILDGVHYIQIGTLT